MKYKLKKDLPFAKAGMDVQFSLEVEEHPKLYLCSQDVTDFSSYWITFEGDRDDLKGLINEGWIIEVKPREWWEINRRETTPLYKFDTYEDASEYIKEKLAGKYFDFDIIKVREVIDE